MYKSRHLRPKARITSFDESYVFLTHLLLISFRGIFEVVEEIGPESLSPAVSSLRLSLCTELACIERRFTKRSSRQNGEGNFLV
jgi:hypothetical protein